MYSLVFSKTASKDREGLRLEAVFCFSCNYFYLAGYCCFNSYCHMCSES